jgi:hypothetical protein
MKELEVQLQQAATTLQREIHPWPVERGYDP